ncbi:MAG: GatB/YqeY domain-containing protein [Chloroflexi bacterium]|nr:GatB/YqeY domain-containing protein [Chloroflexota bacterium]
MTLSERLQAALQTAIRERDELRRDTLRMAVAAAYNAEKQARRPLTDDELLGVLTREVKTRRESVTAFRDGGREEMAQREEREVVILGEFLPQQLGEEELRAMVVAAIEETGAASARDLGKVMGVLSPRTRGRADGKVVSGMVAQELARRDLSGHEHA